MNLETATWNKGYYPHPNTTLLLETITGYENSYNELLTNKNHFTPHSYAYNSSYIQSGPLRECISAHLINEDERIIEVDKNKFANTFLLLDKLYKTIEPTTNKILKKAYVTCIQPNKQIYPHSDTFGLYFSTITRYQFYYTGNDNIKQIINDELFPVRPGYLYRFDHSQVHSYHNNSPDDLFLMVFDILKNNI